MLTLFRFDQGEPLQAGFCNPLTCSHHFLSTSKCPLALSNLRLIDNLKFKGISEENKTDCSGLNSYKEIEENVVSEQASERFALNDR